MEKTIQLKVKKDLDGHKQFMIIRLKGNLISKGYTEIIHIRDEDEDYHINFFEATSENRIAAQDYIAAFITAEDLSDTIAIYK
jgi:hypothetical protein